MTLFIILLTISLIVLLISIILLAIFPNFAQKKTSSTNYLNISIIIAFKNEVKNLENLFLSLQKMNYPQDNFEVILIDDDSTDNSYKKAVELAQGKNKYQVIKANNKKFLGKKGALDIGVNAAQHPFIVITDADCMPANNWLTGYSEKFDEKYEFLFGLAPFIQTDELINKISCYENLRSTILTFAFAELKLPYSAAARNMGFKKSSFEKLGGFSKTMDTISGDDDLLLREAVKQKMKIGIVDLEDSFVLSNSKNILGEYLNQKARHVKTSLYYLPIHQFLLGLWHSSNILMLFTLFLLPLNIFLIVPFLIKLLIDFVVVWFTQRKLKYNFKLYEIPFLQMIYEIFLIINFFSSFQKTIPWKN